MCAKYVSKEFSIVKDVDILLICDENPYTKYNEDNLAHSQCIISACEIYRNLSKLNFLKLMN